MRRPLSIRARLLVLLLVATVILWIVSVAMSYADARRELNELFDAQLAESAQVLLAQAAHDLREGESREEERAVPFEHGIDHPYAQRLHFQVWDRRGVLIYQSSPDLPREPLVKGMTRGYADAAMHGVRWRVAVLTDPESGLQIQLCQRYDAREGVAAAIARNMFMPLAAAVPILALLVWLATGRGIRPLGRFARELRERSPDNLQAIDESGLPAELQPVAGALNGLLARLHRTLDVERRFTADAAHELRTPLAALKTQAQVALGASGDADRAHALSQLVRGTDRMAHLVDQLLTLARVDPGISEARERIDLSAIAREVAGTFAPKAIEKSMELEVTADDAIWIDGNRALVATLVRNLVDNAVRYGRRGGRVRLVLNREGVTETLRVIDDGPGISREEKERVFDRFYRGVTTREGGSGLGLSIVRRIADLHGATIELNEADGGGVEAVVRFPAQQAPTGKCHPERE